MPSEIADQIAPWNPSRELEALTFGIRIADGAGDLEQVCFEALWADCVTQRRCRHERCAVGKQDSSRAMRGMRRTNRVNMRTGSPPRTTAPYVSARQTMACELSYVIYSTTMLEALEG